MIDHRWEMDKQDVILSYIEKFRTDRIYFMPDIYGDIIWILV